MRRFKLERQIKRFSQPYIEMPHPPSLARKFASQISRQCCDPSENGTAVRRANKLGLLHLLHLFHLLHLLEPTEQHTTVKSV